MPSKTKNIFPCAVAQFANGAKNYFPRDRLRYGGIKVNEYSSSSFMTVKKK